MNALLRRETSNGPLFDLPAGRRRRDEGIERVESGGGEAAKRWRDSARTWVKGRAQLPGEFNADDLRAELGPPPGHFNQVGAVFLHAIRQGWIVRVGERPRQAENAHCQRIATYKGAAFAREAPR